MSKRRLLSPAVRQTLEIDRLLGVESVPTRWLRPVEAGRPGSGAAVPEAGPSSRREAGGAVDASPARRDSGPAPTRSRPSMDAGPAERRSFGARPSLPDPAAEPEMVTTKNLFQPAEEVEGQPPLPPVSTVPAAERMEALGNLDEAKVKVCTLCSLCQTRKQTVFGEGNPEARIMFVGEGPGADEDEQGRPFVGRAGELLTRMITGMGLSREQVYIANIVKCRPPGNRTPTPAEAATCWPHLAEQIRIIRPQVLVTLGNAATQNLLLPGRGITSIRGRWFLFRGLEPEVPALPVMPTFHPAYVLRNYSQNTRRYVWEDLQEVLKLLGLPIPKKKPGDG